MAEQGRRCYLERLVRLGTILSCTISVSAPPAPIGNLLIIPKIRKFERNRLSEFEFISLSSTVDVPYASLPESSSFKWDMETPDVLFGDTCEVQLTLEVIDFQQAPLETSVTICIFKENSKSIEELVVGKLHILTETFNPSEFYTELCPVTGFVMGEFNSLIQGFLVEDNFYGMIRIFDLHPRHHIAFYVEPFQNLRWYLPTLKKDAKEKSGKNALLFEYVRHEDESSSTPGGNSSSSLRSKVYENLKSALRDVSERVIIKNGTSATPFFDVRREDATICEVCVWVQPNFADKFGFGGGVKYGLGALLRVLSFVQFIFQGIDFNGDNVADEIKIHLKKVVVSDKIKIKASGGGNSGKPPEKEASTPGPTPTAKKERRRRNPKGQGEAKEDDGGGNKSFIEDTETLNPKEAYEDLRLQLFKEFGKLKCCAVLAYIYHNLAPKLSYSTVGGICSRSHNVGLVSGCLHGHKVGEFDIFRSTMHVLGHLFGAKEDDIANPLCKLNVVHSPNVFNPTLMDSYQKIDVGIRPNSMRFSACAKLDIAAFLTTPNVHCLRSVQATPRCGNGWVEGGEQCDCGLPWQCHTDEMEKPSCCGESDTFLGCKKIGSHRYKTGAHCHRPFVW